MSNFDYGNTRLHAMKARLLTRESLNNLAAAGTVPALLNALTRTTYRTAVEKALIQFSGTAALQAALRQELVETVTKVRGFFAGQAAVSVCWLMRRYDVDNVKAILRGVNHQLPAPEILNATLPLGELATADLTTLAHTDHIGGVLDLLATWRVPLAQPLLAAENSSLYTLEMALEQWYFQAVVALGQKEAQALKQMVRWQADVGNLLVVLRLVQGHQGEWGAATAVPPFIGPGHIAITTLLTAAQQPTIAKAVAVLSHAPYHQSLAEGLAQYAVSQQLSVFERPLRQAQHQQASRYFISDPHGIGILLGYLLLKTAEISNLRHIAHSLQLGEAPEIIRLELL
ncbi:MAG: V-type ATPase subunit [Ardenticatenaceae bacterium]|nr:V-type ATPase subunit [Ardenticatenaceae bacterium]